MVLGRYSIETTPETTMQHKNKLPRHEAIIKKLLNRRYRKISERSRKTEDSVRSPGFPKKGPKTWSGPSKNAKKRQKRGPEGGGGGVCKNDQGARSWRGRQKRVFCLLLACPGFPGVVTRISVDRPVILPVSGSCCHLDSL